MNLDTQTQNLLHHIIVAMNKALSDDYSDFVKENASLDTHCGFGLMKGNFINSRVREYLPASAYMHSFKRFSWQGRIIVDSIARQTFSISTHSNLKSVLNKKSRNTPHFLQSILAVENCKCENLNEQLTFMNTDPFDRITYEKDYHNIMSSNADEFKQFTHYVIAYTFSHNGLIDVDLVLLDSHANEIERISLNKYISPNYVNMAEAALKPPVVKNKSTRNLVSLKKGIPLNLSELKKDE